MAAGTGVRAGAGRAPSAEPAARSARLGYWNSAVTSYYLLTGTTVLLLSLGLVMVLSSSSVDSLAAGQSIQPSEAAKIALAIWLAAVLARKRPLLRQWAHVALPAVPMAVLVVGLVLAGHDLGTALILLFVIAGALFVAGVPMRMLVGMGALAGLVVYQLVSASQNRTNRIGSFLSTNCDIAGACYQTQHGIWGLASGGWWGLGLGASREKWSYLPAAHNDFIFAIIGEELGLLGTLLVLC